jgi:hypothetical protein
MGVLSPPHFVSQNTVHVYSRRVYGDDVPISSFRSMFFNKPAKAEGHEAGGTTLPWHQDRWRHLDRDPRLTVCVHFPG